MEIQKPHNQAIYGHFIVDNIICDKERRGLKNARRQGLPAVVKIPEELKYLYAYISIRVSSVYGRSEIGGFRLDKKYKEEKGMFDSS